MFFERKEMILLKITVVIDDDNEKKKKEGEAENFLFFLCHDMILFTLLQQNIGTLLERTKFSLFFFLSKLIIDFFE